MFDRKICQEVQLLQEVHGKTSILNSADSRVWKAGKDSGFSVKYLQVCPQHRLSLGGC